MTRYSRVMRDVCELPIVQAPMAGGTDSPALAAAVSAAGGLGSLGCAYLAPAELEAVAAAVRRLTPRPFALNLFVRPEVPVTAAMPGEPGADEIGRAHV